MANVRFLTGTYAQYKTITPDDNSLYFLSDGHLFKGSIDYSNQVEVVASLPAQMSANTIYVVTDNKSVVFYDGTASTTIIPSIVSAINDTTDGSSLATVDAIKSFIKASSDFAVTVTDGTPASGEKAVYEIRQGKAGTDGTIPVVGNIKIPDLTISEIAGDSDSVKKYQISYGGNAISQTINIPKDFLVKSGEVKTATAADTPVAGFKVGDKYIDFVINTKDNSGTDEHIYINANDLVDVYTGDDDTLTTGIKVTVDNTANKISAQIVGKAVDEINLSDSLKKKINDTDTATTWGAIV